MLGACHMVNLAVYPKQDRSMRILLANPSQKSIEAFYVYEIQSKI